MYVHNVIVLIDYLEGLPEADRHGLAIIEWRYLPLLESRERPARILHREMARDPEFFADVIEMVFQPENSPQPRNVTQDDRTRATLGISSCGPGEPSRAPSAPRASMTAPAWRSGSPTPVPSSPSGASSAQETG